MPASPRPSSLKKNTVHMMLGEGGKLGIQAIYFVLIARTLGSHQYGAFVAVTALSALVSPFAGTGVAKLMIKHVARDHQKFAEYWGNTLLVTFASGLVLGLGLITLSHFVLPTDIPVAATILITSSEIFLSPVLVVAGLAFQAVEQLGWMANLNVLSSFTRLLAIFAVALLHHPTLMAWSVAYTASTLLSTAIAFGCTWWLLPHPRPRLQGIKGEVREAFYFSASISAQTVYNDVDKTMLARLSTLDAAGIYAAAYRIIDVSFVPVKSLLAAAFPQFFRSGVSGISESTALGRRLLPKPFGYSVLIAIALFLSAPLLPLVLGAQYVRTTDALRWLALLPVLKTVHYFMADSLTGAGYQGLRTLAQVIVAVVNVALNLWLITAYSWRGACWSSLACDGLLIVLLLAVIGWVRLREQRSPLAGIPGGNGAACVAGDVA